MKRQSIWHDLRRDGMGKTALILGYGENPTSTAAPTGALNTWVAEGISSPAGSGEPYASPEAMTDAFLSTWISHHEETDDDHTWLLERTTEVSWQGEPLIALIEHFTADLDEIGIWRETDGSLSVASAWLVDDTHLYLHYNPYEIGPYVMGAPTADIAKADIEDLITANSPW